MLLVTGANGFIGSVLTRLLNELGHHDLLVTDRVTLSERPDLLRKSHFELFIHADKLFEFLKSDEAKGIKAVFHMGACSSTTETNEEFLRVNNTEYSARLFEFCTQHQTPYIYASSGAVYGDGSMGFDDQTPTSHFKPLNPYGRSKLNFDIWANEQSATPPRWYGLRFFNVYGPNEYLKGEMASVVFKAVQQIKSRGRLKLFRSHRPDYEDGKQLRDFVYVKDICRWMYELYTSPEIKSGIYNQGFGQARTWLDLATAVFKNMGRELEIEWIDIPENIRDQYQYCTEAKMDKWLQQGLSQPKWSLETGIEDYLRNYLLREDPYL